MKSKKAVLTYMLFFAIFVFASRYPVDVPCQQCGKTCITECLLARYACNFLDGIFASKLSESKLSESILHRQPNQIRSKWQDYQKGLR